MLHIFESNNMLKNRRFKIPDGIRRHLSGTLAKYKGDKTVNGYKRLNNILSADTLSYPEMKRIKNFFDNYKGSIKSPEYVLNGGEAMRTWVNTTLNTAVTAIKDFKQALKDNGKKNAFRRPHEKNRQKGNRKPTVAKIQTNNIAKHINDNNAIKMEWKSRKITPGKKSIKITETQAKSIKRKLET